MCTCCGLLYNIYMAYRTLFVPRHCINNLCVEIRDVFQSVWMRKKIEKYDFTADFRSMRNRVCKNSATLAMLTHDVTMPALRQHVAQVQSTS